MLVTPGGVIGTGPVPRHHTNGVPFEEVVAEFFNPITIKRC
jgi:hypothetical protein